MSQGKVDWKQKYYELRSKYMNAMDVSFKLGFEEGQKQAELENMQQQVADAQAEAEQAALMEDEMGGEEMPMEEGMEEEMPMEEGGEPDLDSSIDELEQFVKAENGDNVDFKSLMKSFHKFEGKTEAKADTSTKKKLDGILKKMDEQTAKDGEEQSDDDDVIGQA